MLNDSGKYGVVKSIKQFNFEFTKNYRKSLIND